MFFEENKKKHYLITLNLHFPGADVVRFKAEVNFDGREITRCHLNRVDMELLLEVSVEHNECLPA